MTDLRDQFAIAALTALIQETKDAVYMDTLAALAYEYASAMLKAREQSFSSTNTGKGKQ